MIEITSFREKASKPIRDREKGSLNSVSIFLIISYLCVTFFIFFIDTQLPLGVAVGVPYIIPIILTKISNKKSITSFITFLASILTVIGYFVSNQGMKEDWICITNRGLALGVIAIVSMFVIHRISSEKKRKALNERLQELANTDPLVEIGNRLLFDSVLESELDRGIRYNKELSLVTFDIDNFKYINDTFGHDAGDHALKELTELISNNLRKSDYFFRPGGDEFALILTETGLRNAVLKSETLCEIVAAINYGVLQHVTISMGVSSLIKGDCVKNMLKRADVALYKSKENGRNQVQTFGDPTQKNTESIIIN